MGQGLTVVHLAKYLPSFTGGMEAVTEELAKAGVAMGAKVVIIGAEPGNGHVAVEPEGVAHIGLPVYGKLGPVPLAPAFFNLADHLNNCDIVHVHLPNPLAEAALLKYLLTTSQDHWPKIVPIMHVGMVRWPRLGRLWEVLVQKPLLRRSFRLIAASRELVNTLPVLQGLGAKTDVIPFPTAPAVIQSFRPSRTGHELLAIGRLVKYKGFDVLLEALSGVELPWNLSIIGDGPERAVLEAKAKALAISDHVTFLGRVSDSEKQRRLSACDVLVAPSVTAAEAYGLVIAEAFSYGKPVITTRLATGVAYLARGGQCGAIVEPGSAVDLQEALTHMLADPAHRRQCGQENQRFWQTELTRERFAERYQALIETTGLLAPPAPQSLAKAS